MSDAKDLWRRRLAAIEQFLRANAELLGVARADAVGDGPFFLAEWCLVLHWRDLSVDDYDNEPNEVRAFFFRPGMPWSHKVGMTECVRDGLFNPPDCAESDAGGDAPC